MEHIINIIGTEKIFTFTLWTVVAYGVVLCSMLLDMIAAYIRSRRTHTAWVSWKQKKTASKAEKYFFPMVALTMVDLLSLIVVSYPVFTLLLAVVNSLTEWISIFEKSHSKKEQYEALQTMEIILSNRDKIGDILVDYLKQHNYDIKRENNENTDNSK